MKTKFTVKKQAKGPEKGTNFKEKSNELHFYNEYCDNFNKIIFALENAYEQNVNEYRMFQDLDFEEQKNYSMDFYAEYLINTLHTIEEMKKLLEDEKNNYYNHIINN